MSVTVPLPYAWVRSHGVMLAEAGGEPVLLGTAETAAWAVAELRRRHGPLPFQALEAAAWQQRLGEQYRDGGDAAAVVGAAESEVDLDRLMQDMPEVTDLLDAQDDAPVIRMINALLAQAARDGASDLHIEPFETHSVVRYRVDGTLRDMVQPRRALHAALVSRIKIMAHLDIAEKRLPQDGRIAIRVGGRPLDIRVSTVPTGHGERAVLRLLEKDAGRLQLQRLGMADDTLATFTGLIRQPHGIVLVTGPTGSGKTVSLYTALGILNDETRNISTAEDPVEIRLPGVNQVQQNNKRGMTFAAALRSFLRQDPDIIMVGEIRDLETAEIAIKAAQTGHMVLSTLHTNDAPQTIARLMNMGIAPYNITSSVTLVIAQRLARRLCGNCKRLATLPEHALLAEGFTQAQLDAGIQLYEAVGCDECTEGYKGRTGIYQVMPMTDEIATIVLAGGNALQIAEAAQQIGVNDLRQSALKKAAAGITSLAEINRVTKD